MRAAATARGVVVLLLLGVVACTERPAGPSRLVFDRDLCASCTMVISDRSFAAQIQDPKGKAYNFDDLGCAVRWLERQPYAADPAVKVWVTRHRDGAWIDARTARYDTGKQSPMGFNFAAQDPAGSGLTYAEVRARALERTGGHGDHGGH